MKLDNSNKWLTLIANLAVLVGILFLTIELRQANSIANREARSEISSMGSDINRIVIESPEFALLKSKLRSLDYELTPKEMEQAISWAFMQANLWMLVAASYENGLLDDSSYQLQVGAAIRIAKTYPGMFQFYLTITDEIVGTEYTSDLHLRILKAIENDRLLDGT